MGERVWKRLREPTPLTERPEYHTLTTPRRILVFQRERNGSFPREPVISSREFKKRTLPPTMHGKKLTLHGPRPTVTWPRSLKPPSLTRPCPLRRCSRKSLPLR